MSIHCNLHNLQPLILCCFVTCFWLMQVLKLPLEIFQHLSILMLLSNFLISSVILNIFLHITAGLTYCCRGMLSPTLIHQHCLSNWLLCECCLCLGVPSRGFCEAQGSGSLASITDVTEIRGGKEACKINYTKGPRPLKQE